MTAEKHKKINDRASKNSKAHWIVTDDCEYFTAHCSNCNQYADSRSLPKICPKCKSKMEK